jgi:hypothetical protein
VRIAGDVLDNFERHVAFVALKNGEHNGTGYFLDTGTRLRDPDDAFPLAQMPDRIMRALEVVAQPALQRFAAA